MADKGNPIPLEPDDERRLTDDETQPMKTVGSAAGRGFAPENDGEGGRRADDESSGAAVARPDYPRNGNYDFPTAEKPVIDDEALSRPWRYQAGVVTGTPSSALRPARHLAAGRDESAAPHWGLRDLRTLIFASVFILGLSAATVFVLPGATITLVPRTEAVSRDVTFIVGPGASDGGAKETDFPKISALPVETTLTMAASAEIKGKRVIPDSTAKGTVTLRNATPTPVLVPAGTPLGPVAGVRYFTVEDLNVPAADPLGTGAFGSVEVRIIAGVAGTPGNLSAGGLRGQLPNGLYFFNSSPLTGGSERDVSIVSAEDQNALRGDLENQIRGEGRGALKAKLESSQQLVDQLVGFKDWQAEFDHSIGEESTSLKLTLSVKVDGYAYRSSDVDKEIRRVIESDSSGKGLRAVLSSNSLKYGRPEVVKTEDMQVTYQARVTAEPNYQLDQVMTRAIQSNVSGKSTAEAERYLTGLAAVRSFRIEKSLDWFSQGRIPQFQWRISVRISSG